VRRGWDLPAKLVSAGDMPPAFGPASLRLPMDASPRSIPGLVAASAGVLAGAVVGPERGSPFGARGLPGCGHGGQPDVRLQGRWLGTADQGRQDHEKGHGPDHAEGELGDLLPADSGSAAHRALQPRGRSGRPLITPPTPPLRVRGRRVRAGSLWTRASRIYRDYVASPGEQGRYSRPPF